jgi:hypothetical protein
VRNEIIKTLSHSTNLIISPDADGILSAEFLNRYNGSKVVGTYDKNILCLADGINPEECLFVDCDMNTSKYVSIGNHMRLLNDGMAEDSFNPNVHFAEKIYTNKFPYATAFLIADAIEVQTSHSDHLRMAYADSTLRNMESYARNMRAWSNRMSHPSIDYIIENSPESIEADNLFRKTQTSQALVSKRFGKARYIETLNNAFEASRVPFEPILDGIKYMADKVGINTVIRYSKDIISYAEVYMGEYSVTYDQEVSWN